MPVRAQQCIGQLGALLGREAKGLIEAEILAPDWKGPCILERMRELSTSGICLLALFGCAAGDERLIEETLNKIRMTAPSPIGIEQVGTIVVSDACTRPPCSFDFVDFVSAMSAQPSVVEVTGFKYRGVSAGATMLTATGRNNGDTSSDSTSIEVLPVDGYTLVPVRYFKINGQADVFWLPRSCPGTIRIAAGSLATLEHTLLSGERKLMGSEFYPFTSDGLTLVKNVTSAVLEYTAGSQFGPAPFVSSLGPDVAVDLVDPTVAPSIALSDLGRMSGTEADIRYVWLDLVSNGELVCFDDFERMVVVDTPTSCFVGQNTQNLAPITGGAPLQIVWRTSMECTITVSIPELGLSATRSYLPIPNQT